MKKIEEFYKNFIKDLKNNNFLDYSILNQKWKMIIDKKFLTFSNIKDLEKGILTIEVDHSAGLNLIQLEKEKILISLKKGYPELNIKNINFVLKK